MTNFLENLEMSRNFAIVRQMSGNWPVVKGMLGGGNLVRKNCYNVCMVWVADTDCDVINAETQCNHGSLASKKC